MKRRKILMLTYVFAFAYNLGQARAQSGYNQQHYELVLDALNFLHQTGPWLDWNLRDDVAIWERQGFRPIPEDQLDVFDQRIGIEVQRRKRRADWKRNWEAYLEERRQNGPPGSTTLEALPPLPPPPAWQ